MKTDLENYKNIDKSTHCIFAEKDTFKVLQFNNLLDTNELFKIKLENNYIQLFFCNNKECRIAFNMEHCAINLNSGGSSMVYFKDEEMNVLFNLPPDCELIVILISIEYFHSLFSIEGNFLFDISKHLALSIRGRYMEQKANYIYFRDIESPETINKNYGYFSMIGGIKWKL